MTDVAITAITASVAPTLAALGALFVSLRNTTAVAEVAQKVQAVATTTDMIHILTNSAMSAALHSSSRALSRVADLTGAPEDRTAANASFKLYQEHEQKQATVDRISSKNPFQVPPPKK